jgi:hypothetical protein
MTNRTTSHGAHRAAPWLRWLARGGIVAAGMIYLLIGGLALAGAFNPAQHPSGSRGAMSHLARAPLGDALLALLALGLAAYVLWQLIQAIGDAESHGHGQLKRLALRIQHLWDAAVHCLLVGMAGWQLLGYSHGGAHGHTQQHLTATAMHLPGGRWLVAGIGGGIVAFAVAEWIMACRPEHDTQMDLSRTPWRRPILALLVLGHAARGALFGLIGAFLIRAAWNYDALDVTGIAGALQSMRQQPWGAWLLGSVAVGLIAFGLAQFAKARYRVIRKN